MKPDAFPQRITTIGAPRPEGNITTLLRNKLKDSLPRAYLPLPFDAATEEEYREFKFHDSRGVVIGVTIATFFLIIGLWVWDRTVDPRHAMDVLPTRILLGVLELLYPIALVAGMRRTVLPWLLALLVLSMETLFLYHLTLLEGGLVYGLSGFMYWFMISVFTGLSFNLTPTLLTIIAIALLPNVLVSFGMASQLALPLYNALIWPTSLIAMFGNLMLDRLYRRLFHYRRNIEHSARMDSLTGIANRFHFSETAPVLLELCRRHEHPISALMVDIDHFKGINDEYGHLEGDEAIRHVADSMRTKLRSTDLLARYGGEEFVVILPETPPCGAVAVAETIRRTIAETALALGHDRSLRITISVGVAGYDLLPDEIGLEHLLKQADSALYEAKQSGRNRVVSAFREPHQSSS